MSDFSRKIAAAARDEPEFELVDTGVFDERPVFRRHGRIRQGAPDDILMRIDGRSTEARTGASARAAAALGAQHLVMVAGSARGRC